MSRARRAWECGGSEGGGVPAVTWPPDAPAEGADSGLTFTAGGRGGSWGLDTGWNWLHDWDQATGSISDEGEIWLRTTVTGAGTIRFRWMIGSPGWSDDLEFYLDDVLQATLSGGSSSWWYQQSFPVTGAGTHTLKWRYVKDSTGEGQGEVYLDWVQWTGSVAEPATDAWGTIKYVYDAFGRRIEKKYDGRTVLKYIYDGDHCIAEYGAGNDLHRKYLYGPAVDEPISMIETTGTYAGTYYYHCDGLGSVAALTNSSGTTVEVYEYDVYGRPGASVPAHPNRLMFTGREYDKETGLYYYRARYYNPQIGRFLQTDPVGYGAGMNWYAYGGNSPTGFTDPSGLWASYTFQHVETGGGPRLYVTGYDETGGAKYGREFANWGDLFDYVDGTGIYTGLGLGDFCDGKFDRAVFMSSVDAAQAADPSYGHPSEMPKDAGYGNVAPDSTLPQMKHHRGSTSHQGSREPRQMGYAHETKRVYLVVS